MMRSHSSWSLACRNCGETKGQGQRSHHRPRFFRGVPSEQWAHPPWRLVMNSILSGRYSHTSGQTIHSGRRCVMSAIRTSPPVHSVPALLAWQLLRLVAPFLLQPPVLVWRSPAPLFALSTKISAYWPPPFQPFVEQAVFRSTTVVSDRLWEQRL